MIIDPQVLEDDHIPRTLRHRDNKIEEFAQAFRPLEGGREAEHALIFGPSGTGKTCLARYATRKFQHNPNARFEIAFQYVDCWHDSTRFQVLHRVVSQFDHTIPDRSAATVGSLLTRMEAYDGPHFVVILDEAELLEDPNIIRDYHGRKGFSLVVIGSNAKQFFQTIPDAISSRLSGPRVTLETYSLSALVAILEDRVDEGLLPGVIDTNQLRTIANYAAGDAQKAITILRLAANAARNRGHQGGRGISDEAIDEAADQAGDMIQQQRISKFGREQRIIYDIVLENENEQTTSEIYRQYSQRMDADPDVLKSNKTVRRYLNKLVDYRLIEASGQTSARRYFRPE